MPSRPLIHAPFFSLALAVLGLTIGCQSDDNPPAPNTPGPTMPQPTGQNMTPVASPSTSQSAGPSPAPSPSGVPSGPVWLQSDFEDGKTDDWELTAGVGAAWSVVDEPGVANKVLQYTAGSTSDNFIGLLTDAAWQRVTAAAGVATLADYYVEARIKPQQNGTTSNKQIYLAARYQDENNWYLGGLNVQSSVASTRIEAGFRKAGAITRPLQVNREIVQGTPGSADGRWYRVRLELVGPTLTAYLDGENVGTVSDTAFASGKIGLFTANKSFLIDDIVVGDPSVKPVSLTLEPATSIWEADTETAPLTVKVTALEADGVTPGAFTATSSDPGVVTVTPADATITLTPVAVGAATVSVVSTSEPSLVRTIQVTVAAAYTDSPATYAMLPTLTSPAVADAAAYVDTRLSLTFDAPPLLGMAGSIRIFRAADDMLADTVVVKGATDALGPATGTNGGRFRVVNTAPISIVGNTVTIAPHHGALEYGTAYYVGVAQSALSGTLGGQPFTGIGKAAGWTFTTRPAPPVGADVTVDDDGALADFRTVQGALSYLMETQPREAPSSVTIGDGIYNELLFLRNKDNVTIKGASRDGVVIQYKNHEALNGGTGGSGDSATAVTGGRSVFLIENADMLTLDTLTLHNTHNRTGTGDQAETIYFNSGLGRLMAKNATFLSEQDTLQLKGYSWFYNCLVAGNTDFIWGANSVSLFEESEIRMVGDLRKATPTGGPIVQARTVQATDKGFVFLNSLLSHAPHASGTPVAVGAAALSTLARSSGKPTYFDNVAYINCRMDTHIKATGWTAAPAPNPALPTAASGWKEYGSTGLDGVPLDLTMRTPAHLLTEAEYTAEYASRALIFSAYSAGVGWNPMP